MNNSDDVQGPQGPIPDLLVLPFFTLFIHAALRTTTSWIPEANPPQEPATFRASVSRSSSRSALRQVWEKRSREQASHWLPPSTQPCPPLRAQRLLFFRYSSCAAMPEMVQRSSSPVSNSMRLSSAAIADDDDDAEERDPHVPGSIPPWVHISSAEDDTLIPPPVRPNTRHYKPPPSHYKPGRKWDHIRDAEPPLMSAPIADHQTRWLPFMQSGPHPPWHEQGARLMSPEWMEDNVPITVRRWEEEDEALADKQEELKGFWLLSPEKRERTVRLFWVSHAYFLHYFLTSVCLSCYASRRARLVSVAHQTATLATLIGLEVEPFVKKLNRRMLASDRHRLSRLSSPGRAPD